MVRAKPSDVHVWLSRTLGHARWVCCKVIQVALIRTGSSLSTFWSSATRQLYKTPFIDRFQCLFCFGFDLNAHPPYMPFQPALWLSLCLSLLACNASWVELWSKHQDNQKAMEKPQSKRLFTHQRKKKTRIQIYSWLLSSISCLSYIYLISCMNKKREMLPKQNKQTWKTWCELKCINFYRCHFGDILVVNNNPDFPVLCFPDMTLLYLRIWLSTEHIYLFFGFWCPDRTNEIQFGLEDSPPGPYFIKNSQLML